MSTAPFWQLGVVVLDIEAAMSELTQALGLDWTHILDADYEGQPFRVTISRQGPPYVELIEAPPGTPWEPERGSHLDHIAIWSERFDEDRTRLESAGLPIVLDGEKVGRKVNYHALPNAGLRVEVFDGSDRDGFRHRWGFNDVG